MNEENIFEIQRESIKDVERLRISGYLDAHTAPRLESAIEELFKEGKNKILVNFRDLEYISSAGLGVFMGLIEEIRADGGDLKMSDMKPKVFDVFDLLGFPILFDIDKTDERALAKFDRNDIKNV